MHFDHHYSDFFSCPSTSLPLLCLPVSFPESRLLVWFCDPFNLTMMICSALDWNCPMETVKSPVCTELKVNSSGVRAGVSEFLHSYQQLKQRFLYRSSAGIHSMWVLDGNSLAMLIGWLFIALFSVFQLLHSFLSLFSEVTWALEWMVWCMMHS